MQGTNARCLLEKVFVFGVWGAVIDINQIIFELFCRVQIIAAIDLCITRQTRHNLHAAAEVLDFAVKVVINRGAFGARANKAHFAHKDIEQLRQFVEVGQAQDTANAGNACVIFAGPFRIIRGSALPHGTKFVDSKRLPAVTKPYLCVNDLAGGIQPNNKSNHSHGQCADNKQNQRTYKIKPALEGEIAYPVQ